MTVFEQFMVLMMASPLTMGQRGSLELVEWNDIQRNRCYYQKAVMEDSSKLVIAVGLKKIGKIFGMNHRVFGRRRS